MELGLQVQGGEKERWLDGIIKVYEEIFFLTILNKSFIDLTASKWTEISIFKTKRYINKMYFE